jgi:hypothetical protein
MDLFYFTFGSSFSFELSGTKGLDRGISSDTQWKKQFRANIIKNNALWRIYITKICSVKKGTTGKFYFSLECIQKTNVRKS